MEQLIFLIYIVVLLYLYFDVSIAQCMTNIDTMLYQNYSIDYILSNINSDSSIYYLGQTSLINSSSTCLNHCKNYNYICDKSENNTYRPC